MLSDLHLSVASPAGAYTVGNGAFFRSVVRLAEARLPLAADDREALEMLATIPHAFEDDDEYAWGRGWRILPALSSDDWPVLEATPQHVRAAFERARRMLWEHAGPVGLSGGEIVDLDDEFDKVLCVLQRAEDAGVPVNLSYVS